MVRTRIAHNGLLLCSGCKTKKPLILFNKNRSKPTGYGSYCKDCVAEVSRRQPPRKKQSPFGKADPVKAKIRTDVREAVRVGKILKPNCCQNCNATGYIEAHHPDYSKPFEVEWLCGRCHGIRHRKFRHYEITAGISAPVETNAPSITSNGRSS